MATVAIAGGHGQIARLLHPLLAARGDRPLGLIRDSAHARDLMADGAEPLVCDLEQLDAAAVAQAIADADAVVFAAGAGPGSGAERKRTVDYEGAVKLMDAAKREGVRRYVMVSAMGARADPPRDDDVFSVYLRAKHDADRALEASGLDFTIVRPGRLTDDPPSGHVAIAPELDRGEVPRADVAAVVAAVLAEPGTIGRSFDLVSGDEPIGAAVRRL